MKQFLDRFDQSSIWIRILVLAVLMLVLMTGLVMANGLRKNQNSTTSITAPLKSSTTSSSSSSEEQGQKEAEEAVKKAEDEQNEANLREAKAKVEALKQDDKKGELMNRLQAVANALGIDLQTMTAVPTQASVANVTPEASAPAVNQTPVYTEQPIIQAPTTPTGSEQPVAQQSEAATPSE